MLWRRWTLVHFQEKFICISRFLSISQLQSKILIGCGNPLLDISATVDKAFIKKYDLTKNQAIMAEEKHKPLYKELIENYNVDYIAGGSVQNTLRACQWVLQKPFTSVFFGCVGCDNYAKILKKRARKDGVVVRYQRSKKATTGTCVALITGTHRTLIARLGAAEHFDINFLSEKNNWSIIENAKYFYISGFFLASSVESVMKVAQKAAECNNCFAFNLSATFISQDFMPQLKMVMPYIDILFGNDLEADAFAVNEGWTVTDRKEIGQRIQKMPKINNKRSRLVIIHQGPLSIVVIGENCVEEFKVPNIAREHIVDTNGAGDAFVGGFLAQYMREEPLEKCMNCGIYAAQYIIGQSGVRFKGKPNFLEK